MPVPNRPDVRQLDPAVRTYIEYLEAEIERLEEATATAERETVNVRVRTPGTRARTTEGTAARESYPAEVAEPPVPVEPPTTKNVISVSASGVAKRTPRHLYGRQRRGGMGIFDLDTPESDPPAFLTVADEAQHLLLVSTLGRAFRLPVKDLPETPVRGHGISLAQRFNFLTDERLGVIFPDNGGQYLLLVTQRGQVRRIRYHYLGESVLPGTVLHDIKEGGAPAAVCWSPGDSEIFIVTRQGLGIRFSEKQVPVRGCLGIRVDPGDVVTGVAAVPPDGRVFILANDGKGAARDLATFTANKAPGSGGKVAMKAEKVVGAAGITEQDDIFAISRLGKIIRFQANEVPPKEGPVQGVNCMALRADETTAMTVSMSG
jgi:DNA gyrase subunit A